MKPDSTPKLQQTFTPPSPDQLATLTDGADQPDPNTAGQLMQQTTADAINQLQQAQQQQVLNNQALANQGGSGNNNGAYANLQSYQGAKANLFGANAPITETFGQKQPGVEVFSNGITQGTGFAMPIGTPLSLPKGKWTVLDAYAGATHPGYIGDGTNNGYGNSVVIKNDSTGETLRFSHLSKVGVLPGQSLTGGIIGLSGATGNVTGPHVNVEYRNASGQLDDLLKTPYVKLSASTPAPKQYQNTISQASKQYGVPDYLLTNLLNQESGFNPSAKSPAGALGIAQFMPNTAKEYGINPLDPTQSILGAARYLQNAYQQTGNWQSALAAYNAGLGAVKQYGGVPPYAETQNYVNNILPGPKGGGGFNPLSAAKQGIGDFISGFQSPDESSFFADPRSANMLSPYSIGHSFGDPANPAGGEIGGTLKMAAGIPKVLATTGSLAHAIQAAHFLPLAAGFMGERGSSFSPEVTQAIQKSPEAQVIFSAEKGNPLVQKGAQLYNALNGLGKITESHNVPVDQNRAQAIGQAYERMPQLNLSDPQVQRSYQSLANEVQNQWDFAKDQLGINFEPWAKEGQPYQNSKEMMQDVAKNKHLYFFTGGEPHPLLGSPDAQGLSLNDKFRAIHDLFGHAAEGFSFGPRGEENAWLKHSQMFSPEAQKALTTETRGQNSWVNFGPQNYDAQGNYLNIPVTQRPFAQQKVGILPDPYTDWQSPLAAWQASQK